MSALKTIRYRDLSLTAIPSGGTLVTACDSCGSIGSKPDDLLQIPAYYSGRFTARVPILEVLSCGAEPIAVVNTVSCEMEPTGREIIRGVQDELRSAGIDPDTLTGSTEENFPSKMTALGITVVGYLSGEPNWQETCPGDLVYCIGKPKVGSEVGLDCDPDLASYDDLKRLKEISGVKEIIPTGSKGIRYEVDWAARKAHLRFHSEETCAINLEISTGPAACLVVIASPSTAPQLESMPRCSRIGVMISLG